MDDTRTRPNGYDYSKPDNYLASMHEMQLRWNEPLRTYPDRRIRWHWNDSHVCNSMWAMFLRAYH